MKVKYGKILKYKKLSIEILGQWIKKQYYDWDFTHNDIEVYNSRGQHLGSMNPVTGEMYKHAVPGRIIKVP